MWYSPESFVLWASLVLLAGEPLRTSNVMPSIAARAARVAACEAPLFSLPESIDLGDGLQPIVRSVLEHSPTFRQQCRELAAAPRLNATVRVSFRPAGTSARALTTFRQDGAGTIAADIEIWSALELTELLAHELEHVLEQVRSVNLPALARRGEARRLPDGSYETMRAIQVGQQVDGEVVDNAPDRVLGAGASMWRGLRRVVGSDRRVAPAAARHEQR